MKYVLLEEPRTWHARCCSRYCCSCDEMLQSLRILVWLADILWANERRCCCMFNSMQALFLVLDMLVKVFKDDKLELGFWVRWLTQWRSKRNDILQCSVSFVNIMVVEVDGMSMDADALMNPSGCIGKYFQRFSGQNCNRKCVILYYVCDEYGTLNHFAHLMDLVGSHSRWWWFNDIWWLTHCLWFVLRVTLFQCCFHHWYGAGSYSWQHGNWY